MRILTEPQTDTGRVLVLGMMDGMHLGHRKLVENGRRISEETGLPLTVSTYDRHPLNVLAGRDVPMLMTLQEKAYALNGLKVDEMLVTRFTSEYAAMSKEEYLKNMREKLKPAAVVAGFNHTFGEGGMGTTEDLVEDGRAHGYRVVIVPPVMDGDTVISSTGIRRFLSEGRLAMAAGWLGYDYIISGRVEKGKHIGTELGFATANIRPASGKLLPKHGVYACYAHARGQTFAAVVNIGVQPTCPSGQVTVEAHLLTDPGDMYDEPVWLTLKQYLREEKRFESMDALSAQIAEDVRRAKHLLPVTERS